MADSANPLMPAAYDIVWSGVSFVMLVLLIVALVSIARTAKRLTSGQSLCWTLLAIFLPVVGPLAWFAIGRRSALVTTSARVAATSE